MLKALTAIIIVLLPSLVVAHPVSVESPEEKLSGELVIEGTGDSEILLRAIVRRFGELHPRTHIDVPGSTGSSGGIWGVAKGEIELARTARPLKEKEISYGLASRVFAKSPLVFAVNPSVEGIDNLTYEQIIGIYTQRIIDWKDISKSSAGKTWNQWE